MCQLLPAGAIAGPWRAPLPLLLIPPSCLAPPPAAPPPHLGHGVDEGRHQAPQAIEDEGRIQQVHHSHALHIVRLRAHASTRGGGGGMRSCLRSLGCLAPPPRRQPHAAAASSRGQRGRGGAGGAGCWHATVGVRAAPPAWSVWKMLSRPWKSRLRMAMSRCSAGAGREQPGVGGGVGGGHEVMKMEMAGAALGGGGHEVMNRKDGRRTSCAAQQLAHGATTESHPQGYLGFGSPLGARCMHGRASGQAAPIAAEEGRGKGAAPA